MTARVLPWPGETDAAPEANAPLAGAHILIVEDEVLIAFDLRDGFEEDGAARVDLAHTLPEALALAAEAGISAAVLDVRLGQDAAGPVAQVLTDRGVPFLFYTGQPASDPVRSAWPDVYTVAKPSNGRQLVDAVRQLLADRKPLP